MDDIDKIWAVWYRINDLEKMEDSGEIPRPEHHACMLARETLIGLILEHKIDIPFLYPTPNGSIQAEFDGWMSSVELVFNGDVERGTTAIFYPSGDNVEEREFLAGGSNIEILVDWLIDKMIKPVIVDI